jgi:hypothetical protein
MAGHLDRLEGISAPRPGWRSWPGTALELFGIGAIGWTVGSAMVEVLSRPGLLRIALIAVALGFLGSWLHWRTWPRALYLTGVAIAVLTLGGPLLRHFFG